MPSSKSRVIRDIVNGMVKLPSLPVIVWHLIELIENPKTAAIDLAKHISTDQTITARILKVANSSFYSFPQKIGTVKLAIVMLGFDAIKEIILTTTVFEVFANEPRYKIFNMKEFWKHSIAVGLASKNLAKFFGIRVTGELFVAGLIHDIGKIVLNQYYHGDFVNALNITKKMKVQLFQAENSMYGTNHAEVGKWLAEKWKFPDYLVTAISDHHDLKIRGKDQLFTSVVHLADALCRMKNIGESGNFKTKPFINRVAWDYLQTKRPDLNYDYLKIFSKRLNEELHKGKTFLDLVEKGKAK